MMEETYKKVLALDSSGLVASVAVVEGDGYNSNLLAEYTVNYKTCLLYTSDAADE